MLYSVVTHTTWQQNPTYVQFDDIKATMPTYPLIESKFFDDLVVCCRKTQNYYVEQALLQIQTEEKKKLNPDFWILIWGIDFKDRLIQLLIERNPSYGGKGALAGIAPKEFVEFISSMKYNAILPTLTLLNTPEKMKQVAILVSRTESSQDRAKGDQNRKELERFKNWIDNLKQTPNVKGQWYPQTKILNECPKCGASMAGIAGNNALYGILICPNCGHTLAKSLQDIGQPDSKNNKK
jgi:hypothetical protein